MCDELGGCAVGDDFSAIDDDRAGASGFDFFEDVRGKQDGFVFAEAFDELADFVFLVGVEAIGGLIENENFRIMKEGLGEAGAVAVAFGEGVDGLMGDTGEEAGFDGFFHSIIFR